MTLSRKSRYSILEFHRCLFGLRRPGFSIASWVHLSLLSLLHQVASVRLIEIQLNIISQARKASGLTESSDMNGHWDLPWDMWVSNFKINASLMYLFIYFYLTMVEDLTLFKICKSILGMCSGQQDSFVGQQTHWKWRETTLAHQPRKLS